MLTKQQHDWARACLGSAILNYERFKGVDELHKMMTGAVKELFPETKPVSLPEMKPVVSSNVRKVGWLDETLYVEFKTGAVYCYTGVSKSLYLELLEAQSIGHFLNDEIKKTYPYTRIS